MDEQRFDDIIKGKVGEYVDPTFDQGAIAGLHQHLAAHQVIPWYVKYQNVGMMAATLAVFTLMNWWIITNNRGLSSVDSELASNSNGSGDYQIIIDELRDEIDRLKTLKPDTIYVVNQSPAVASVIPYEKQMDPDEVINRFLIRLQGDEKITSVGDFYFYSKDEEITYSDLMAKQSRDLDFGTTGLVLAQPEEGIIYRGGGMMTEEPKEEPGKLPVVVIRDLEKRYSKGLGLKIGAEAEFAMNFPEMGTGEGLPGIGVLAELVLSPSLGLETGFKYKTRSYAIDEPNADRLSQFPDIEMFGTLEEVETDAKLIEIPVNLKYYHPLTQQKDVFFGLGISHNIYLSQTFEYGERQGAGTSDDQTIVTEVESSNSKFYVGTVNAMTGMNFDLPKRRSVQIGLFYQKSVSGLGLENGHMSSVGLKSSYWFRVR